MNPSDDRFETLVSSILDLSDRRCEDFFCMIRTLARLKENPEKADVDKVFNYVFGDRSHLH